MFSGQMAYAQQLAYPMQARMNGGMTPAPPPFTGGVQPPPSLTQAFMNTGVGGLTTGQFGEQFAASVGSFGRNIALPVGMGALSLAGGMGMLGGMGRMLDPMSAAISAGRMGMAMGGGMTMGGLAMGGLAAGAAMLPAYAVGRAVDAYGGAFMGGMQDQVALNSTLRQNFQFMGGQGFMGRGFGTSQMGAIGNVISQELRNNVMTNAQELNGIIAGGAQSGMFSGVRDVQQFTQRFREMLSTLRTVQRELGGSLSEALNFVSQSRAAGVFSNSDRVAFAAGIRQTSATTGLDQAQLLQMSMQGAQIARAAGGAGRQGAFGALRAASTLGSAIQSGAINETMLSEATGGLTGADAIQAFTSNMMQRTAQFARRPMGRFSIFSLSNSEGTGLDQGQLDAFLMGDTSVGDISRRAHRNVARMGRARAINNEGLLRGALLEQGGLAGQIGMMRQVVGDRVLDQGDDLGSLVLQRRFRMSRPEAEVMMSLMRNQGNIAAQEAADTAQSDRQSRFQGDVRENRSFDSFMAHLGHGIQEATGVTRVREMGRTFMTRFSSTVERAMNDMLGIANESMSQEGQRAMSRLRQGRASRADLQALGFGQGGFTTAAASLDIDRQGLLEHGPSVGARLRARGMSTTGIDTYGEAAQAMRIAQEADAGILTRAGDIRGLARLNEDVAGSTSRYVRAQLAASGTGNADDVFRFMGGSGNATAAFAAQQGLVNGARADGLGRIMGRGGGGLTAGMFGRDALRVGGILLGGALGGAGGVAGLTSFLGGMGDNFMRSEVMQALRDPQADNLDFLASGGHYARTLRERDRGSLVGQSRLSDIQQGELRAMGGVSRETLQGLQGNADFMRAMRGVTSARTAEGRQEAMQRLTRLVGGMEDGTMRTGAASLVRQMETSMERNNGQLGSEFGAFISGDPSVRAARQQLMEYNDSLMAMSRRAGRGSRGAFMLGNFSRDMMSGDEDRMRGAQDRMRRESLAMSDDEFRNFSSSISRDAEGNLDPQARAMVLGMARDRQLDRALRGDGRRDRREAVETAIGEATGYMSQRMSFTVGGREITGQRGQRLLQAALSGRLRGDQQTQVVQQFASQLGDMGFSADQQREIQGTLRLGLSRMEGGGLRQEDRERLMGLTRREDIQQVLQQAQEEQRQATLSAASARDPVGAETNRILGNILTAVQNQGGGGDEPGQNGNGVATPP